MNLPTIMHELANQIEIGIRRIRAAALNSRYRECPTTEMGAFYTPLYYLALLCTAKTPVTFTPEDEVSERHRSTGLYSTMIIGTIRKVLTSHVDLVKAGHLCDTANTLSSTFSVFLFELFSEKPTNSIVEAHDKFEAAATEFFMACYNTAQATKEDGVDAAG